MKDTHYSFWVLKTLRAILLIALLGVIPAVILVWPRAPRAVPYVLATAIGGLLIARIGFQVWRCPSCRKPFCRTSGWTGPNMFTRQCVHCGLRDRPTGEETRLNLTGKPE